METDEKPKKTLHLAIQYNSMVILTYTFLSLAVFIIGELTKGASTRMFFMAYRTSFADPLMYVRLFTHVLGHASFSHFFSNFLIILLVGPMIEEKYGSVKLLALILITAFVTGLLHVLMFADTALLGASGVVFMLILLSSYANYEKGKIPLTLILVVITFIGKELIEWRYVDSNISNLTHIVGGAIGGVCGYFINGKSFSRSGSVSPPAEPE